MPIPPPGLNEKVLGSPADYPPELTSWIAKKFSNNRLLKVGWPQLPGPKITSIPSSSTPKSPQTGDLWFVTDTALLKRWNGSVWVTWRGDPTASPGFEVGYDQITAGVNVVSVSGAAPTAIIAGTAHAFDGAPVLMEFFCPQAITPSVLAGSVSVGLYDAAAPTVLIAFESLVTPAAANLKVPIRFSLRFTPAAGNRTYNIGAFCSVATGTPSIQAGAGTGGAQPPAYLRFTKV